MTRDFHYLINEICFIRISICPIKDFLQETDVIEDGHVLARSREHYSLTHCDSHEYHHIASLDFDFAMDLAASTCCRTKRGVRIAHLPMQRLRQVLISDSYALASSKGLESPPGFSLSGRNKASTSPAAGPSASAIAKKQSSLEVLRTQKAWDLAIAPAKAVPMQGFMVYMSGGGVQIFSLMIVYQLVKNAITGMMGVGNGASISAPEALPSISIRLTRADLIMDSTRIFLYDIQPLSTWSKPLRRQRQRAQTPQLRHRASPCKRSCTV